MYLTHKIKLDPTPKQAEYFRRAAGTARFVYNWALAEWNCQYAQGGKPCAGGLKKRFNALYKTEFPWAGEVGRDCRARPFVDLQTAFTNFFARRTSRPQFKSKRGSRPSFYASNDRVAFIEASVKLPIVGLVRTHEELRFKGRINAARVVCEAGAWYICVSVDVGIHVKNRTDDGIVGVDLGLTTLATLSTGEKIANPRPLKKAQKRLRREQRRLARKVKGSKNRERQRKKLASIHKRISNIRHDNLHKLTTRLCRENQAVGIEGLRPKNMLRNHSLAQALSDVSFGMFRQLMEYKAGIYRTRLVVADTFFPSSKMCSGCGRVKDSLSLSERTYRCKCGLKIDRDLNAAVNLKQLAVANGEVTPVDTSREVAETGTAKRKRASGIVESRLVK